MIGLFNLFVKICLLRAKPQDVPAYNVLLVLTLAATLVSGVPLLMDSVGGIGPAFMIGVLDASLIMLLLYGGLYLVRLRQRLLQTATAIFGSGVFINLLSLPVQLLLDTSSDQSTEQLLGAALYLFLLGWSLVILGNILRHAFDMQLNSGVLVALAYFMLINMLVQLLLFIG